jgi:HK97 gp10 family phage protein
MDLMRRGEVMPKAFIDITMLGDKELEKALAAIDEKMQKKLMQNALREGAKIIAEEAKARVSKDSGALAKSIRVRTLQQKKRGALGVQVETGTRQKLGIPAEQYGYYPAALEYGWRMKRTGRHVAAKPYMRPALDSKRGQAFRVIGRLAWKSIKNVHETGHWRRVKSA